MRTLKPGAKSTSSPWLIISGICCSDGKLTDTPLSPASLSSHLGVHTFPCSDLLPSVSFASIPLKMHYPGMCGFPATSCYRAQGCPSMVLTQVFYCRSHPTSIPPDSKLLDTVVTHDVQCPILLLFFTLTVEYSNPPPPYIFLGLASPVRPDPPRPQGSDISMPCSSGFKHRHA